jgi:hypothetical protein
MSDASSGINAKRLTKIIGTQPSDLYCSRLLAAYNAMRDPKGGKGDLLSHVPEWALSLAEGDRSQREVDAPEFSEETLRRKPRLQAALANCTSYTPNKWLLEQELSARKSNATEDSTDPLPSWDPSRGVDVYDAAATEGLKGLALSGGGIRSATFCLGILQSLAAEGVLEKFDYLSSVSGGGYIHQWLAAWIRREPTGMEAVIRKMRPLPERGSLARAPEQINWLRRYSSYLTPRRGPFTADTWTMIAIWFRNTGLNQIVLFSFLFVCLEFARTLTRPFQIFLVSRVEVVIAVVGSMAALWCFLGAKFFGNSLASQTEPPGPGGSPPEGAIGNGKVLGWIVAPGFVLSILLALITGTSHEGGNGVAEYLIVLWSIYILTLLLLQTFKGRAPVTSHENDPGRSKNFFRGWFALSAMLCTLIPVGAVGLVCSQGLHLHTARALADSINRHLPQVAPCPNGSAISAVAACCTQQKPVCIAIAKPNAQHPVTPQVLVAIFFPLVFFGVQWLCVRLQLGILGRGYEDSRREWLARLGAWAAIVSVLWFVLGSVSRVGPSIFYALFDSGFKRALYSVGVTIVTHAAVLYAGGSSKTSGSPDPRRVLGYSPLDMVGIVGAPIAILFLLIIASGCVDVLLYHSGSWLNSILVFLFSLAVLLIFGCRVDINEFSMHPFYRNRLARCYLGASNGRRVPDPFTGFDDHEEASSSSGMTLAELLPERFGGVACRKARPYDGPMPIFCSTVNLTSGADLAYQDRKGASFAFTPMYSGYHVNWTVERKDAETTYNGFVPTREYAYRPQSCEIRDNPGISGPCCERRTGILLGSVAAISGAALSPNQGYNSQPSLAFLMTLFNVRLGWWIANTRKPKIWPNQQFKPSPRLGLVQMIKELCGSTDDTTNYLCLSDGGQFDNMGLYELVRRRASLIVVCDGEEDLRTTFEGMGLAVAKARIDFGVDIQFDQEEIDKLAPDKTTGRSKVHLAVGTIQYPSPPASKKTHRSYRGTVVYLKTAFVGDEPLDLQHYKREHPDFPQEGTLNQWFTEAQFESYRSLGQLTGQKAAAILRRLIAG